MRSVEIENWVAPFICIYCLPGSPVSAPSEAHICPRVLGGSAVPKDAVRRPCNSSINTEIEIPAQKHFSFFRVSSVLRAEAKGSAGFAPPAR